MAPGAALVSDGRCALGSFVAGGAANL